jgi:hypothetical protein
MQPWLSKYPSFKQPALSIKPNAPPPALPPTNRRHHPAQKFESAEAAAALMASEWRLQTFFGQHRLHFQYAYRRRRPPPASPARSGDGGHSQDSHPPVDWVCEYCGGVNFGR